MSWFEELVRAQGETLQYYSHSFGSVDNDTGIKAPSWGSETNFTAIVRSQPVRERYIPAGPFLLEELMVMTETNLNRLDRIKWNSKYYEITVKDDIWFKGEHSYYRFLVRRVIVTHV